MKTPKNIAKVNNAPDTAAINTRMQTLIELREEWEKGVNTTAKQRLYELLQQCYQLHAELTDAALREDFCAYFKQLQPKFRLRTNTSLSLIHI